MIKFILTAFVCFVFSNNTNAQTMKSVARALNNSLLSADMPLVFTSESEVKFDPSIISLENNKFESAT